MKFKSYQRVLAGLLILLLTLSLVPAVSAAEGDTKIEGVSVLGTNRGTYTGAGPLYPITKMVDGINNDTNNFWNCEEYATTCWFTIDLGVDTMLSKILVYSRANNQTTLNRNIKDYDLYISNEAPVYGAQDGSAPTGLPATPTISEEMAQCTPTNKYGTITLPAGSHGRYVTIHCKSIWSTTATPSDTRASLNIQEIEFYGKALKAPADKLSGFSVFGQNVADYDGGAGDYPATMLLDGITNKVDAGIWCTKSCTEAYITFDAGSMVELEEMQIYARPHENTYNRFVKDYEVYVSAFAPTYGAKDGTVPTGLGKAIKSGTLSACNASKVSDVISLPEGTKGQYITLHVKNIHGGITLDLAEVEFYGTELDGSSVAKLQSSCITYFGQNVADYDGGAGNYPATMLLDGITNKVDAGIWCTKSCTEAYITFDLGRSYKMHSLDIYARNHKNTVNRAVKEYEVYLSDSAPVYSATYGEVPTGIGALATEGELAAFSTTEPSRTVEFPSGGEGRYLTLHVESIHGGPTLDLAEIEFFVYTTIVEKAAQAVENLIVDYETGKLILPTAADCTFELLSCSNTDVIAMDGTAEILYGGTTDIVLRVTDKNGNTATTDAIPVQVLSLRQQMASPCKLTEVEAGNFAAAKSEINLINGIAGGTAGGGSWSERYWATEDGVKETEVLLTMAEAGNVAGITMLPREEDATKFPQEFEVLVSADGKVFTSAFSAIDCTARAAEKQTFCFDVQEDVKFVKVVMKTAATRLELSELEVLTTPDLLTSAEAAEEMLVTQQDKSVAFKNITEQFAVEITESSNESIVAKNGTVTLPDAATDVTLSIKVTNRLDTADVATVARTLRVKTQAKLKVEQVAEDTDLIPIPELNSDKLTYPTVPEGYSIKIAQSDTPAVVDTDGNIIRSDDTTYRVRLTFEITDTATGDTALTKALLVPVYKTYVAPTMSQAEIRAIREDYKAKKYGIFIHYIPESNAIGHGTVYADGNVVQTTDELVENFDAEQFAKDVHDFGVEYVVFTVWHYQGQALFPSMTMQRWRDDRRSEGNTDYKTYADGDLIEELLDALEPYGIDLHLYNHPAGGVSYPTEDKANVGWDDKTGNYATWNQYINELYYELGDRYGDRLKGLWLDGLFSHIPSGAPQSRLRATAEMFNPAMILTMNAGFQEGNLDLYPQHNLPDNRCWEINRYVDYINDLEFARYQVATCLAAQYWWTMLPADTSYKMQPASEMFRYMVALASISEQGGLLASTGIYPVREGEELDSIWLKGMKENLTQVGEYLKPVAESVQNTAIGRAFPTTENSTIAQLEWGVSTESRDGKNIYLHVLKAPAGNTLTLPETADGSVLAKNAVIMNFDGTETAVTVTKTDSGYSITLPEGTDWSEVDTVIKTQRSCVDGEGNGAHTAGELIVDIAATCVSKGVGHKDCATCGTLMESNIEIAVDPNAHTGNNHIENKKDATCAEKGYTGDTVCECGKTVTEGTEIPVKAHTEETVAGKEPTCTETGLTEGKKCSVCGTITVPQTEIPVKGHTEETVAGKEPTCTETGLTEGKKCSVCDATLVAQTEIPAKGHGETEVKDAKAATCTAEGYTGDTYCTVCDTKIAEGETVAKTAHKAGDWVTVTESTVTTEGLKEQRCSECNELLATKATPKKTPKVNFVDVQKNDYFYLPVAWAVDEGITTGTSKTEFSPAASCTRAQAVTFLWRAAGQPTAKNGNNPFTDVKKSDYYYKAVLWAVESGITKGVSKTSFAPDATCTRGQIVTFLWRAQGAQKVSSSNPFTDVKKSDFYYNAVLWAVKNNVTAGMSKTSFAPNVKCTRGQIVTFLYRAVK